MRDVTTGTLAGSTVQEQARRAFANCETVLRAAGATLDDVAEVDIPTFPGLSSRSA
jgi:2-iminobutanoate/2-iminopropanoate deaminase